MTRGGRLRRTGALVVAALLLATVAGPAAADEVTPRGIDRVCPVPQQAMAPSAPSLSDLGTTHAAAITCASEYGLVSGFADGTYRPERPVTRGQMASFVAFWLRAATGFSLSAPDTLPFEDIEGTSHEAAIAQLADAGIVGGRADGTFGPNDPLTRGQFAQVVVRAISYADVFALDGPLPPAGDASVFSDMAGTTFEEPVGALVATGITAGMGDGTFRPNVAVTRGQLATFLLRGADYLDRHQRWRPTARTRVYVAELRPTAAAAAQLGTRVRGTATITVNAFDGTLFYAIDLAGVPGPFAAAGGATVDLVLEGGDGSAVIVLADGASLEAAGANRGITGSLFESASNVRFAELAVSESALVSIATDAFPDGAVQGELTRAN